MQPTKLRKKNLSLNKKGSICLDIYQSKISLHKLFNVSLIRAKYNKVVGETRCPLKIKPKEYQKKLGLQIIHTNKAKLIKKIITI